MNKSSSIKEKLHAETARIHWTELQPHFARGSLLYVAPTLDLIEVAMQIVEDKAKQLEPDLLNQKIAFPSDNQAKNWFKANTEFWAVVVAPYVLIQQIEDVVA